MDKKNQKYTDTYKDGSITRKSGGFYRGENANFLPSDQTYESAEVIDKYLVKGMAPEVPFIEKETNIVAFGSCFARHVSNYLKDRGYNVATKKDDVAYISRMSAGIVNTFAVRQQFEWAWLNKSPQTELWHGYDALALGYDEEVRVKTEKLLNKADVFIITLGLAEVWYDEPTKEVFWRAVPKEHFDASRHKFRVSSVTENLENLKATYALIRERRPDAKVIFTVSPIPLLATFRDISCYAANSVSKSILRVAIDEFMRENEDANEKVFYFPSYEIVLSCFNHRFLEDRRHVHKHVLDFNMKVFEKYFCQSQITTEDVLNELRKAQKLDRRVGRYGHWAVLRTLQKTPFKPTKVPPHIWLMKKIERQLEKSSSFKVH